MQVMLERSSMIICTFPPVIFTGLRLSILTMPIPAFTAEGVLPPHLGNPTKRGELSPYPVTTLELCGRFNSSPKRISILRGFLEFRAQLRAAGITAGFHWLDGSFLEDVEHTEGRDPNDLDVVTFFLSPSMAFVRDLATTHGHLIDRPSIKKSFFLDHFLFDLHDHPEAVVEHARYWTHLFSHRRDKLWKGMLRIELNTVADDADAAKLL